MKFRLVENINNNVYLYRGLGENNNISNKHMIGEFYTDNVMDASNYGDKIKKVELKPNAKIYKYQSSLDYCQDNNLMNIKNNVLYEISGEYKINNLAQAQEELEGYDPNLLFWMFQYMAYLDLSNKGYDGAEWMVEDDIIWHQYQIWNPNVVNFIEFIYF